MYEPHLRLNDYARITARRSQSHRPDTATVATATVATARSHATGRDTAGRGAFGRGAFGQCATDHAAIGSGRWTAVFGRGRGRVLRLAVLALVAIALMSLAFARTVGAAPENQVITVQPGQTLWSIASAQYPGDDPRARIADIERVNGLDSGPLQPGEKLTLPH